MLLLQEISFSRNQDRAWSAAQEGSFQPQPLRGLSVPAAAWWPPFCCWGKGSSCRRIRSHWWIVLQGQRSSCGPHAVGASPGPVTTRLSPFPFSLRALLCPPRLCLVPVPGKGRAACFSWRILPWLLLQVCFPLSTNQAVCPGLHSRRGAQPQVMEGKECRPGCGGVIKFWVWFVTLSRSELQLQAEWWVPPLPGLRPSSLPSKGTVLLINLQGRDEV